MKPRKKNKTDSAGRDARGSKSSGAGVPSPAPWSYGWTLILVLLLGLLVFLPSLEYDFVFDDHNLVENSPRIKSLSRALAGLTQPWSYRPLRDVSYALDYALGGDDPLVFHLSNILYHLLVLGAAWLVLLEVVEDKTVALVALAFFALHPVHIDAVTYISGRRDLLCVLFVLLSFWQFVRLRKNGGYWRLPLILLFFLLAIMAKELGLIVPLLIFSYDWLRTMAESITPSGYKKVLSGLGRTLLRGWWYYGPFVLASIWTLNQILGGSVSGKIGWWGGTLWTNILTMSKVVWYYLWLMIAPLTLRGDYSYDSFPVAFGAWDPLGLAGLTALVALGSCIVYLGIRGRFQAAFWSGWFFISLIPMIHIIPHHELMAEHYLYGASLGFCVLAAWAAVWWFRRRTRWSRWAGVVPAIFWGCVLLAHQPVYANDLSLFSHVSSMAPHCIRANSFLGARSFSAGRTDLARMYYRRIADLPVLYEREGFPPQDWDRLWRFSASGRTDVVNRELGIFIDAYQQLGKIYAAQGRPDEAVTVLSEGSRRFPVLYSDQGRIYAEQGRYEEAVRCFLKVIEEGGNRSKAILSSVHYNLGAAYLGLKNWPAAVREFRQALATGRTKRMAHGAMTRYYLAVAGRRSEMPAHEIRELLEDALKGGLPENEQRQARMLLESLPENPSAR